jgi:hypothetical protein
MRSRSSTRSLIAGTNSSPPIAISVTATPCHARSRRGFVDAPSAAGGPDEASAKCSRTLLNSCARSTVDAYRSAGFFARHRSTTHRAGAGNDGLTSCSGRGSLSMIAESVWTVVPPANARRPVASSYRIAPSENWSAWKPAGRPAACSGDM